VGSSVGDALAVALAVGIGVELCALRVLDEQAASMTVSKAQVARFMRSPSLIRAGSV
jgi:hypothetical protein